MMENMAAAISSNKTLLIIPCFNESQRIQLPAFHEYLKTGNELCFTDDGSTDGTMELLRKAFGGNPQVRLFRSDKNLGKAGIIRAAALNLIEADRLNGLDWIGYWDADLATPLSEVPLFIRFQNDFAPKALAVFGSRVLRLGADIHRSPLRHYFGRGFATLASMMLGVRSYDSQCGAKLFHRSIVSEVFKDEFISRWIFDLEILLRIGESKVVEYPVSQWHDIPGSKVKILREIFRVLMDLQRIRDRYN